MNNQHLRVSSQLCIWIWICTCIYMYKSLDTASAKGCWLHNCFCLMHTPAGSNVLQKRSRSGASVSGLHTTHMLLRAS